jgi:hypothetical protein
MKTPERLPAYMPTAMARLRYLPAEGEGLGCRACCMMFDVLKTDQWGTDSVRFCLATDLEANMRPSYPVASIWFRTWPLCIIGRRVSMKSQNTCRSLTLAYASLSRTASSRSNKVFGSRCVSVETDYSVLLPLSVCPSR